MLLKSYTKEIFRPECNPSFQSLHCIAHLNQDIKRGTSQPECGEPTRMAEGVKGAKDCPPLSVENRKKLQEYMSQFLLGS